MSQACSVSAKRRYGWARVCRAWKIARSSVYHRREIERRPEGTLKKRGPLGGCTDDELVEHIRRVLRDSPWVGEGYRKTWAQLRHCGVRVGRPRVLRSMRENGLQSPQVPRRRRGPKAHDRSIIPERPDKLWGTDGTSTLTEEGQATIFFVIDHMTAECLGIHAARRGTRFEALEPMRQAVKDRFGHFEKDIAREKGLSLRHDHGSQFVSNAYQDELRLLGIRSSPAFVREPQGNGCAERFVRTLKEQLLWLRRFETVDELLAALHDFKERYNNEWMIERHGYLSPRDFRKSLEIAA